MAKLKIKLIRNLRRSILRGHPWIYRDSIEMPSRVARAQMARVFDPKGELGWAMYDPHSVLALRVIQGDFEKLFARAYELRAGIRSEETNAYRLFNGEGDGLPGLVCDVYADTAVLQFDGQGPSEFWDRELITNWLLTHTECKRVLEKKRGSAENNFAQPEVVVQENGVKFKVNLDKGQKTGFFLDQRDNRNYVRQVARNKSVLNLFSYTGGFSVYAGLGGATRVASLDISKGALELAEENWALNGLSPEKHQALCVDVFEYLKSDIKPWDHIIVDPPSMTHSKEHKETAVKKYTEIFAAAAKKVKPQGELSVSSCSGHIGFDDFLMIIEESLSLSRRTGRILRVSGQGMDHPFPHVCPELRYLKFVHLALD